jgi:hypothetical protein
VLHGSRLDQADLKALRERVARCDDYLRRMLRRLLSEDDLRDMFTRGVTETIEKYFLERLLPPTGT